mmetsp:Transcript_59915/g.160576  ORF Transcript_59915/g.160576 Transcript_59915/m.160576 type:complete len:103 (+) Transcript_59915:47-355(+)
MQLYSGSAAVIPRRAMLLALDIFMRPLTFEACEGLGFRCCEKALPGRPSGRAPWPMLNLAWSSRARHPPSEAVHGGGHHRGRVPTRCALRAAEEALACAKMA